MRIGQPALKHGVAEPDALHAVRNAMRRIVLDEHLTTLIGPAMDGRLLEVGVLDLNGDDPVVIHAMSLRPKFRRFSDEGMIRMAGHTDEEIERAAERFEQLAEDLDPADGKAHSTEDLHQVAVASDAIRADEVRLREAVESARARGRSWNEIAVVLGVSRQAARQRFADKTNV